MPRNKPYPTPEEQEEKVSIDLPPDEAIRLIMETGEHPDDRVGGQADPEDIRHE